ncbi:MAG: transferrin-binding protein-like solute binding protein [Boseongicola sp. SB0662_bin_57]|nr:transferrin-binding protein-like solute binding protein [Boseongicola sp. SB0662_bin_57]
MSVAVLAGAMALSGCKGGGSSPALPPPLEPPPQAETPAPSGPEPTTPVQQPQPEPAPQPQTSSPAPTPPPSQHTGHPALQSLQNIQNMPDWWHRRPSFEELLETIMSDTQSPRSWIMPSPHSWMMWQAAGDIGSRHQVTVDGVRASRKGGSEYVVPGEPVSPDDAHADVTKVPHLDRLIRSTEDAGAIWYIPIAINHQFEDASGRRVDDRDDEFTDFGGWMDYSFFFVSNEARGVERVGGAPLILQTEFFVFGDYFSAWPTEGKATWRGAMIGVDHDRDSDRYGRTVVGESYLQIGDFSDDNSLSVRFTGIVDTTAGQAYPDITWDGVQLRRGHRGSIQAPGLYGAFYGPGSEEAAGVFTKDGIAGAFGASRDIDMQR